MSDYIGARYVPKFMGPFDNTQSYEALCVVDNGSGTSYISKKTVPAGTPLTNTTYWAIYGSSSGAIINLQNQIDTINSNIQDVAKKVIDFAFPEDYGAVGDGITDDSAAIQAAFDSGKMVAFKSKTYAVSNKVSITANTGRYVFGNGATLIAKAGISNCVLEINNFYGGVKDLVINCDLRTDLPCAIKMVSTNTPQTQFYILDNILVINALVGIWYGDGNANAQSENSIHNYRTRSVICPLYLNQPNGMLFLTDCQLDSTPYEWISSGIGVPTGADKHVINQLIGTISCVNCTLESPSYSDYPIRVYDGMFENCIIEIAGTNIECYNLHSNLGETYVTFRGCKFYESQGANFITSDGLFTHANVLFDDCILHGSSGAFVVATQPIKFTFNNVVSSKDISGRNIEIVDIKNSSFGANSEQLPLLGCVYTNPAKLVKASKEFYYTLKGTSTANGNLVEAEVEDGTLVGSNVPISYGANEDIIYTNHLVDGNMDCVQTNATNCNIDEIRAFSVESEKEYTSASTPTKNYAANTFIKDSTGALAGWFILDDSVVPVARG